MTPVNKRSCYPLARRNTGFHKGRNKDRYRQQTAPKKRQFVEYKGYTAVQNGSTKRIVIFHNGQAVYHIPARKPRTAQELTEIIENYIRSRQYGKSV